MDKLSDELTATLRAKLAQEVEVRDVFKKDIETKSAECVVMARRSAKKERKKKTP